jgi:rhamnosyl/mannosyltransferase
LDVQVFCFDHVDRPTREESDEGVNLTRFRSAFSFGGVNYCPELISAISALKVDLLHLHVPNPIMVLSLMAARPKNPVVVTYQSDIVRQRIRYFFLRPLEHSFYRRVKKILCTSEAYIHGSSFLHQHRDQVAAIPMGIDLRPYLSPTEKDVAESRRIQASYPGPLWLFCGRLVYYKGMDNALRALPSTPGNLLIVGDGPERDRLQKLAKRLGVSDRAIFIGELQPHQVIPYYLAARAFWFPSNQKSEAFGLAQVEAMATGCPVINTAIPGSGVPWVSRHEETGLTVGVNDPTALSQASERLLKDPKLRDRLGRGAQQRARQEFDHLVMAKRYLSIYQSVLGPASANVPAPGSAEASSGRQFA